MFKYLRKLIYRWRLHKALLKLQYNRYKMEWDAED